MSRDTLQFANVRCSPFLDTCIAITMTRKVRCKIHRRDALNTTVKLLQRYDLQLNHTTIK